MSMGHEHTPDALGHLAALCASLQPPWRVSVRSAAYRGTLASADAPRGQPSGEAPLPEEDTRQQLETLRTLFFSELEARAVLALETGPLKGQAIANRLRMPLTTKLKANLTALRERGVLGEDSDGYQIRHRELIGLARATVNRPGT